MGVRRGRGLQTIVCLLFKLAGCEKLHTPWPRAEELKEKADEEETKTRPAPTFLSLRFCCSAKSAVDCPERL